MNLFFAVLIAMSFYLPGAYAAGAADSETTDAGTDSAWGPAARQAIADKDWDGAIDLLQRDVTANTATADTYNYLGFAYRKLGDYQRAFDNYAAALKLDPDHKGALEYSGEAYLAVGDLQGAKKQLAALDRICFFGCQEFDDLKAAVAAYRPK